MVQREIPCKLIRYFKDFKLQLITLFYGSFPEKSKCLQNEFLAFSNFGSFSS